MEAWALGFKLLIAERRVEGLRVGSMLFLGWVVITVPS